VGEYVDVLSPAINPKNFQLNLPSARD